MGTCDTWNVEVNILVYEDEVFICLVTKFHWYFLHKWVFDKHDVSNK